MYQPSHFQESDWSVLAEAARDIQFACIVTPGVDRLHATHAPCVVKWVGGELLVEGSETRIFARLNPEDPTRIQAVELPERYRLLLC